MFRLTATALLNIFKFAKGEKPLAQPPRSFHLQIADHLSALGNPVALRQSALGYAQEEEFPLPQETYTKVSKKEWIMFINMYSSKLNPPCKYLPCIVLCVPVSWLCIFRRTSSEQCCSQCYYLGLAL